MNDEIKEILDDLIFTTTLPNVSVKLSEKKLNQLKDYITNLQQKVEQYENPDDLTLFYMWLDEKAKDKMKELQQENEKLKDELEWWKQQCDDLEMQGGVDYE